MPLKEQLAVDERKICRECREQVKEQEKTQTMASKKGESLANSRLGSSTMQRLEAEGGEPINSNLIPTPEKEEDDWRVEEVEERLTSSLMTLTPRGRISSVLHEEDGGAPLATQIRLSNISQSSGESFIQPIVVLNKPTKEPVSVYKNKLFSKMFASQGESHHCEGNMDSIFQGLRYDDNTEPSDHLVLFKNILKLKNINDGDQIITRFFNTLRGPAIAWYQCATLENPIWTELQNRFLERFQKIRDPL